MVTRRRSREILDRRRFARGRGKTTEQRLRRESCPATTNANSGERVMGEEKNSFRLYV